MTDQRSGGRRAHAPAMLGACAAGLRAMILSGAAAFAAAAESPVPQPAVPPQPAMPPQPAVPPLGPQTAKTPNPAKAEDLRLFGDWKQLCEPAPDKSGTVCFGFQKVSHGETHAQLLQAVVGYFRADITDPSLIVTVPLGAYLRPGLELRLKGNAPIKADFQYCFSNGCQAAIRLDKAKLDLLKAQPDADVMFLDAGHQRISVPLSFKGFAPLVEALKGTGAAPAASR